MIQAQLINSRYAIANVLQNSQHQQEQQQVAMLQPAYSNNSSASTNLLNLTSFTTSNFDALPRNNEDDEEQSQIPTTFPQDILRPR
ncbi:hypothetical protein LINGRAHAP2_LOCUS27906 [Linum grandiflorum]